MPFDSSTSPDSTAMMRLFWLNTLLHDFTTYPLYPALTGSGRPNPSSALGWAPATNVVTSCRKEQWRSRGYFCITAETTKGYEMAPNYNLKVRDSGTTPAYESIDCRSPVATTTHYSDPYVLAARVQAQLNANANLSGTYTVTYSGYRVDSSTYKWTIACDENFDMDSSGDANTILPSLGYTSATYTSAGSYVGDERAIMTEEYLVWDIVDSTWNTGATTVTSAYRWLILVDPDWDPSAGASAGDEKTRVYLSSGLAGIDAQPDSNYTEHEDLFKLNTGVSIDVYDSLDTAAALYRTNIESRGAPRIWLIDIGGWRLGERSVGMPTDRYVRLKVVDPKNANGSIGLGYAFLGGGWYPARNYEWNWRLTTMDRAETVRSPGGTLSARFRAPARTAEMTWRDSLMSTNDHLILDEYQRSRKAGTSGAYDSVGYDMNTLAGSSRAVLFMDPHYAPLMASAPTLSARGTIFGRAYMGTMSQRFTDLWNLSSMTVEEEPF